LSWFECATTCKNLRKAVDRFIFLALDFSIGAALAAGGAAGSGEAAALVCAEAAMFTQRTRVAMHAPMTNEGFVFMFLSVLLLADKPTGTA
jgi:hypothetical protein